MTNRHRPARTLPRRRLARVPLLEGLEPRELLATYAVGPGQAYASIGAVPWSSVAAGDTVAIHWQAAGYHEKLLISGSGTASQPINIVGVAGPQGQRPVIDGANATTNAQFHFSYAPQQVNALVLIQRSADQPYGTKPSFINISGLELKNAYQSNTFRDASGANQTYDPFAAAVYIQGANNITLKNDTLDNSGLGLFVLSNGDEAHTSRNILVDGNSIYGNGVPGQYLEHNVYSEAVGITYQYNDFGPTRDGSAGNNLKDRSAGAVIRYNHFAPGGHILDLVDPEDSDIVASDPSFANTYVYGNVLDNTGTNGATFLVHFGGDSGNTSIYRPHLEFYDNTVVDVADQGGANGRWRTVLFQMDTAQQSVNAFDNLIYNGPATPGAAATSLELIYTDGSAKFGVNWVSPGWTPAYDAGTVYGSVSGTNNFYVDPGNNPKFVNFSGGDYHLAPGSSAIGRGVATAAGDPTVTMQYQAPASGSARATVADLGAFASGAKAVPAVASTSPAGGLTGVATSAPITATFNVAIASGLSFTLAGPSGAVAAAVSYADPAHLATLVPSSPLAASTTYTATIGGAKDASGTPMAAPYSWSFTTAAVTAPAVKSTTPAPGSTGVATSAPITATFNVAIASGLSFTLAGPSGAVAAAVSYADPAHLATLVPSAPLLASTTYTATIGGAKDASGHPMASPYSWSFTTAAPPVVNNSFWSASTTPANASADDTNAVELGIKFSSTVAGSITGIRFYKGSANAGAHVGHLWSSSGALLATATFTGETANGWQQVNFSSPVAIAANTTYVASYFAPNGGYAYNSGYFSSAFAHSPLQAPANAGVYRYGSTGGFPTSSYNATNYWVDVQFKPSSNLATTARPAVAGPVPAPSEAIPAPAVGTETGGPASPVARHRNGRRP